MNNILRIALAQVNSTVGDLEKNYKLVKNYIGYASEMQADIVLFPELVITGYPPEDLLHKPSFVTENIKILKKLAAELDDIVVIAGFVNRIKKDIYNSAAVLYKGEIKGIYNKMLLPNYGVFDEMRYFLAGDEPTVFRYGNSVFGVNICEDIWHKVGPTEKQVANGAQIILNINASPYHAGKLKEREEIIQAQAKGNRVFIAYVNMVGGQDELVFDGQSMVVDEKGKVIARAEAFKEDLMVVDIPLSVKSNKKNSKEVLISKNILEKEKNPIKALSKQPLEQVAEIYQALMLGLKDYVNKNGFNKVVIGISGGVDSALVATLAVDALGKENVTGIFMPSRYTSEASESDSRQLAKNLGMKLLEIPIEDIYSEYLEMCESHFSGFPTDIAEENMQARIRGNILMAFSNKFGWLVLTTGNKSEMSVGYATLYGDMAGGFALIKDVLKTMVYKLVIYRNKIGFIIPENIVIKEPTAELKHNQKDSDSLPVYEILDPIIEAYVEDDKNSDEIVSMGYDKAIVKKVLLLIDRSEYKRRQSPPGIKITPKAFGRDRRMPITNKYHD